MKIKDIAALCKKRKRIQIATEPDGEQYIGDGAAIYKISGLPQICGDEVMTLFDLKEKEREKIAVTETKGAPLDMEDCAAGEKRLEAKYFTFSYGERMLLPLSGADGLLLIDRKYLKPLAEDMAYLSFWRREDVGGQPYIVLKAGLLAQAAIMPFRIEDTFFINNVYELANGLDEEAAKWKLLRERTAGETAELLEGWREPAAAGAGR